jgi:hypothetical protein
MVMHKNFEAFVTQELWDIENRENVLAVIYLKDIECAEQFREIYADDVMRSSTFGRIALDRLADQVTRELLKQLGEVHR